MSPSSLVQSMLVVLTFGFVSTAHGHLMSRGHGTINVVNGKAYLVVSLPVSVFNQSAAGPAVSDGVLTTNELNTHRKALSAAIRAGLTLQSDETRLDLSTILLNLPKGSHHTPDRSRTLTAMIVAPLKGHNVQSGSVAISSTLWSPKARQLKLKATVTEGGKTVRSEIFALKPNAACHRLFIAPSERTLSRPCQVTVSGAQNRVPKPNVHGFWRL